MYDSTPLLSKKQHNDRFINNISITGQQNERLLIARKKIRKAIREAFTESREYLKQKTDIQERDIDWISKIKPKFMTQGSYAYKTLNSPCYTSQEIDLDDGVYLPMSIMQSKPEANKDWFFAIVDGALKKLALQEGWIFTDEKDTCARVTIPNCQTHLDVPLYAIPDYRHIHMTEALTALNSSNRKLSDAIYSGDLRGAESYLLDEDEVYLATREEGWKKSDPLLIANWFKQQISLKGERLRRVCRYLKSWRDFTWDKGGPSSLTLMICAVEAYPVHDYGRDDYALLKVANVLPERLLGRVLNPAANEDEVVYPRGEMNVDEISTEASKLAFTLEAALNGGVEAIQIVENYTKLFGRRIPQRPDFIEEIGAAQTVRAASAVVVSRDPIPNTKSG